MRKPLLLIALALLIAIGWKVSQFFSDHVDWPLIIANAKVDVLKNREAGDGLAFTTDFQAALMARQIDQRVSLEKSGDGNSLAVVVSDVSEHTCLGLKAYPPLKENFTKIDLVDGVCKDGAQLKFWFSLQAQPSK